MPLAFFVAAGLVATASPADGPRAERAAYEAEQAGVGCDPRAHVKLACSCKAHGLPAERLKHLAIAVLLDPKDATAQGLMGMVAYGGAWRSPEAVSEKVRTDATMGQRLAEYNGRRASEASTADAQWQLALWCEQNGLDAEAKAHLTTVVRLDPAREAAWKRLGCKKVGGRWIGTEQLAAEKAEGKAQKQADKKWKSLLAGYRDKLGGKDKGKQVEAEQALASIRDPRTVPAVWATFARGDQRSPIVAAQLFGQIDATDASRALAVLAVFSPAAEVRRVATQTLRNRDGREVIGWLIALIRKPMKYEVRPVAGAGTPGVLFIEGEKLNLQRFYDSPSLPNIPLFAGEPITYDQYGLPVVSRMVGLSSKLVGFQPLFSSLAEQRHEVNGQVAAQMPKATDDRDFVGRFGAGRIGTVTSVPIERSVTIPIGQIAAQYQASAMSAARQLQNDVSMLDAYNTGVWESNMRVVGILQNLTGQRLDPDQQAWAAWWADQQGYAYRPSAEVPKPTLVEEIPPAYKPQAVPLGFSETQAGEPTETLMQLGHSCFRAGTPVRTLTGPCPIESVAIGDRVLVEDTETGALSYQPVLVAYHNRPALLYRIELGGDTLWATGIHRFWKAAQGWVMARDLKPGDILRTLGGTTAVGAVEQGPVEPVFNLEVAFGQSFFVGKQGALAHDNSLLRPHSEPFDAATSVSASATTPRR